jgi:hypothetical protein
MMKPASASAGGRRMVVFGYATDVKGQDGSWPQGDPTHANLAAATERALIRLKLEKC